MPTYEYICDACGYEFEQFQSIKADPIRVCPNCGEETAHRKISGGAAIIFKGGGFYETDYRSESYNAAKKKDTEGASGGEKKSETKSEPAKPAASESAPKPAPAAPAKADKPAPKSD